MVENRDFFMHPCTRRPR